MREHFGPLLGVENALDNPNDLLAYGYDASGLEGKARIVLFPKNAEDLRQILVYANRTNIPVVTRGLGANPLGMVVPENSIVLDMAHFDRISTLNLKEGWVRVETGVVLSDLQRVLEKHGHTFPVVPGSKNVATIGALLAMNQMDRRSHKHGRLGKHVMELEVIDGTGKHYPEQEPKFIGMEGTCAIIISAKIRVYPIIEKRSTDVLPFDQLHELLSAVDEKKEDLTVLSLEYMNPQMSRLSGIEEKHHLLVEYEGDKGEIVNPESQDRIWKGRDQAWDAAMRAGHPIIEDCSVAPEKMYDLLAWCEEQELPAVSHIGMGIVHPFFGEQDRTAFYEKVKALGGDVSGQFGYGLVKKKHVPQRLRNTLIKLKDEYDYNDILNRGRLHDYA